MKMSARAKAWAKKARVELMMLLGGVCAKCGATDNLTFDCIEPTGDDHHRGSTDQRMSFYRRQHFEFDNLQLLCNRDNSSKGDHAIDFRPVPEAAEMIPF